MSLVFPTPNSLQLTRVMIVLAWQTTAVATWISAVFLQLFEI